jgi:hypothetical protein
VSQFTLPLSRLMALADLDPLVRLAVRRVSASGYETLGHWLAALDVAELHTLRALRAAALEERRAAALDSYLVLTQVIAVGEGVLPEDDAALQAMNARLTSAVTLATLVHLDYATVDWSGVSIDPAAQMPWDLTEAGRRHVQLHGLRLR